MERLGKDSSCISFIGKSTFLINWTPNVNCKYCHNAKLKLEKSYLISTQTKCLYRKIITPHLSVFLQKLIKSYSDRKIENPVNKKKGMLIDEHYSQALLELWWMFGKNIKTDLILTKRITTEFLIISRNKFKKNIKQLPRFLSIYMEFTDYRHMDPTCLGLAWELNWISNESCISFELFLIMFSFKLKKCLRWFVWKWEL